MLCVAWCDAWQVFSGGSAGGITTKSNSAEFRFPCESHSLREWVQPPPPPPINKKATLAVAFLFIRELAGREPAFRVRRASRIAMRRRRPQAGGPERKRRPSHPLKRMASTPAASTQELAICRNIRIYFDSSLAFCTLSNPLRAADDLGREPCIYPFLYKRSPARQRAASCLREANLLNCAFNRHTSCELLICFFD